MRSELDIFPLRHRIFLVKHYYQAMGDLFSVKCQYEDQYRSTSGSPKFSNEALVEVIDLFENTGSVLKGKSLGEECQIKEEEIIDELVEYSAQSPTLSTQTTETVLTEDRTSDFGISDAETRSNEEFPLAYDSDTQTRQQKEVPEWWNNPDDSIQMEDVTWNRWLSSDENVYPEPEGQASGQDFTFDCVHPNCSKSFVSFSAFNLHRLSHIENRGEIFKCSKCDKIFLEQYALQKHFRLKHFPIRYKCKLCGCSFRDDSNYFSHLEDHERDQLISQQKDGKSTRKAFNVVCPKSHENTVEKYKCPTFRYSAVRYKCEICSLDYKNIQCLRRHIQMVHLKEAPFKCHLCPKVAWQHTDYQKHIRRMHNIEMRLKD